MFTVAYCDKDRIKKKIITTIINFVFSRFKYNKIQEKNIQKKISNIKQKKQKKKVSKIKKQKQKQNIYVKY